VADILFPQAANLRFKKSKPEELELEFKEDWGRLERRLEFLKIKLTKPGRELRSTTIILSA